MPAPPPPRVRVRGWATQADGTMWAATEQGLWFRRDERWRRVEPGQTSYAAPREAGRTAAVDLGPDLAEQDDAKAGALLARIHAYAFPRADVRGVAVDAADTVWVATSRGLVVGDGHGTWYTLLGLDGLPYADVHGVTTGPDGSVWAWFRRGLARLHEGRWIVFAGPRWLPEATVRAGNVDADGSAWVQTETRTTRIYAQPMTLSEKAAHYEAAIAARHERQGYVADCRLQRLGDLDGAARYASDNDGLWTGVYVAAESYHYAVTGEGTMASHARALERCGVCLCRSRVTRTRPAHA